MASDNNKSTLVENENGHKQQRANWFSSERETTERADWRVGVIRKERKGACTSCCL